MRAGVGLAAGGDVAVAGDVFASNAGIGAHQRFREFGEALVLNGFEGLVIAAFQFNADGEVVAGASALEAGGAGMPGAPAQIDELDQLLKPSG